MKKAILPDWFNPFKDEHIYIYNKASDIFDAIIFYVNPNQKEDSNIVVDQINKIIKTNSQTTQIIISDKSLEEVAKDNNCNYLINNIENGISGNYKDLDVIYIHSNKTTKNISPKIKRMIEEAKNISGDK